MLTSQYRTSRHKKVLCCHPLTDPQYSLIRSIKRLEEFRNFLYWSNWSNYPYRYKLRTQTPAGNRVTHHIPNVPYPHFKSPSPGQTTLTRHIPLSSSRTIDRSILHKESLIPINCMFSQSWIVVDANGQEVDSQKVATTPETDHDLNAPLSDLVEKQKRISRRSSQVSASSNLPMSDNGPQVHQRPVHAKPSPPLTTPDSDGGPPKSEKPANPLVAGVIIVVFASFALLLYLS